MNTTSVPLSTDWQFSGFAFPNYTSVPDQLFDELMPRLSGAELKVLLYIIRRTFGFKKNSDDISLSQMVNGIKKQNGKVLDQGTGLGKASVARALNSLEEKKIILRRRRSSEKNGDEATTYTLNIISSPPVSQFETPPVPKRDTPVSHQRDTQQTVLQQTVLQQQPSHPANDRDIVVALMGKGVTKSVAQKLASGYRRKLIFEKIELLEYKLDLQAQGKLTGRAIGDPAAFLIDAIKKDYQLPLGFKTKAEREAIATTKKQHLQAQQKLVDERRQQKRVVIQQQELERAKRLETMREEYHTTEREARLWRKVLRSLREQVSGIAFKAYLAHSVLLSLRENQALIAVPNGFVKQWVEQRLATPIQTTLARHLGTQEVSFQCLSLADSE